MSNSQPCQPQPMISPSRPYSNWPGTRAVSLPHCLPSQSGPPWWGQRLRRAKNSPPTLKTPIERPATSTILREPGGISSTGATTCLAKLLRPRLRQPVERLAVLVVDLGLDLVRQLDREGLVG